MGTHRPRRITPLIAAFAIAVGIQLVPNTPFVGSLASPWGGIWMRLQPGTLAESDDWATDAPAVKDALAAAGKPGDEVRALLVEQYRSFYLYEHLGRRYPYISDPDAYYWMRGARKIEQTGHAWDALRDAVPWDLHGAAPTGIPLESNAHFRVLSWLQEAGARFEVPPMESAAHFGILVALLSLIPAFLIGARLGGALGGFLATTAVAIAPAALRRTLWGSADPAGSNLFFPLLALWLVIETLRTRARLAALALGAALAAYTFFGLDWFLTYDLVLATLAFHAFLLARRGEPHRLRFASVIAIVALLPIVIVAMFNRDSSVLAPFEPFGLVRLWAGARAIGDGGSALIPSIDSSLGELRSLSFGAVVASLGIGPLFGALAGAWALRTLGRRSGDEWLLTASALTLVWTFVAFVAGMRAARMTLLLPPLLALGLGGLGRALQSLALQRRLPVLLLCGLAFIEPASASFHAALRSAHLPRFNAGWQRLFEALRTNTPPSAILTSWTDDGQVLTFGADRGVTLDGASQAGPRAYWVARAFTTPDEEESAGILRMLACGGGRAHEAFATAFGDEAVGALALGRVVRVPRTQADAQLAARGLDSSTRSALLTFTHCVARDQVVIVSGQMMRASATWSRFGGWSVERAWLWQQRAQSDEQLVGALADRFAVDRSGAVAQVRALRTIDAAASADWIAPPRNLNLVPPARCQPSPRGLACENGLLLNPASGLAAVEGPWAGLPEGIAYWNELQSRFVVQPVNGGGTSGSTALIFNEPSGALAAGLMPSSLAGSMFVRLFFMNGRGLTRFAPLATEPFVDGDWVSAFRVRASSD